MTPTERPQRILITGGAGQMATLLRPRLRARGYALRLLDVRGIPDPGPDETLRGTVGDDETVRLACRGVDAVVHLGGIPTEAAWHDILTTNVDGTERLLRTCADLGVPKVVLASSNHAVGLARHGAGLIPADVALQPDSYYGFSKAAIELLGMLAHQRHGIDVSCLRIGRCAPEPPDRRALINWLSPDDAGRLVHACLAVAEPGFRRIWGVSANTRSWFDPSAGRAIGYLAEDDSERFAAQVEGEPDASDGGDLVGGHFAFRPLGADVRASRRSS